MTNTSSKRYRLHRSRQVMLWSYDWYKKEALKMPAREKERLETLLSSLDTALLAGDRDKASHHAHALEALIGPQNSKSYIKHILEFAGALLLALFVAALVRQTFLENQEIPTGSMRPTYKEQDRLIVSKTAFGIKKPFTTDQFYFDPSLVKRTMAFTFSADGLPMQDADSTYFGIFPYKKRLIKRVMGKPGDQLYFYGGKVYGIDAEGNEIQDFLTFPWMDGLEHIPFMNFSGEIEQTRNNTFILKQMNLPLGKITLKSDGQTVGELFNGKEWKSEDPAALVKPHNTLKGYSDFWGIGNYAMVQLLTPQQIAAEDPKKLQELKIADLYLELRHTPNLAAPQIFRQQHGFFLALSPYKSYIPLSAKHLNAIMEALYTARFVVRDGLAMRYSQDTGERLDGIEMEDIPNGTYEFYYGKAYQIGWGGIAELLSIESPLYDRSIRRIQQLFNLGIDLHPAFSPRIKQLLFPHRYAYFREGDLYLMGAPILKKDDPNLQTFIAQELARQEAATTQRPYVAFVDRGPPLMPNGRIDKAFIETFGLKIPEGHYLALGDNHAMSGDSRIWGFVPEANIEGSPSFVYWPPSDHWGSVKNQPITPWVTLPHVVVWGILFLIIAIAYIRHVYIKRQPIFKKILEVVP